MYEVYIAGDVGEMKVLSIAEAADDSKLMTLYMPGDAQLSESFMSATLPQINSLYFDYTLPQLQMLCKKNGIDADGMQLSAIVFVADDILSFCEMQFRGEYELSISWNISIDGEISLADCYIC